MQAHWRTATREELIAELERRERENERLRCERDRAERDRDRYRRERDGMRKKIERLEDNLDAAQRALHRQAAPFSRGTPRRHPRRPGANPARRTAAKPIGRSRRTSISAMPPRSRRRAQTVAAG